MRDPIKRVAGLAVEAAVPRLRFASCIFLLGHMRCGSTALSNVLCEHPQISGYGEAHVRYGAPGAVGQLALNQLRRRALRWRAPYLYDKLLHSRLDADVPPAFFQSRAIFVTRDPERAVPSIRALFAQIGSPEYGTDEAAAVYCRDRLRRLAELWDRFAPANRIAIPHAALIAAPERQLERLSRFLGVSPRLRNSYRARVASGARGAGDPINAQALDRITTLPDTPPARAIDIPDTLRHDLHAAYAAFLARGDSPR